MARSQIKYQRNRPEILPPLYECKIARISGRASYYELKRYWSVDVDTDHVEKAIKNETKMPEDKSEGYVERRKCWRIERKGNVIETEIIEWKKGGRMERRRRKTSR